MAPHASLACAPCPPPARPAMLVLWHIAHPELEPIRISGSVFAVGRAEAPFDTYPPDIVADLSRRHARIFCEGGIIYLADLDSKNGTTVNGVAIRHAIARLNHGAEVRFGQALTLRVELAEGAQEPGGAPKLASLTLRPEGGDLGLQPIVISEFPFLISKEDDTFARYKDASPHQVNYLSRRHAHIFLNGGQPFVEDLGSTNGTFVANTRLDEHAVALKDGAVIGFGGHHFVYRIGLQWTVAAPEPTVTRLAMPAAGAAAVPLPAAADKTTFVAAADSFLDIFCVDQAPDRDDELNGWPPPGPELDPGADPARPHGKVATFLVDLMTALGVERDVDLRRALRWGMPVLGLAAILAWSWYRVGAPERDVQKLLASGDYARAAAVASNSLAGDPDNALLKTLGTEALLKASVPTWAASLKARQFTRAAAIVAGMRQLGRHDRDLQALVGELESIGNLEQFVSARGGPEAPSRSPADAARVKLIVKQWEDDSEAHQRAFATISSQVPEYRDAYAEALSHVRKLALSGDRADHEPAATP